MFSGYLRICNPCCPATISRIRTIKSRLQATLEPLDLGELVFRRSPYTLFPWFYKERANLAQRPPWLENYERATARIELIPDLADIAGCWVRQLPNMNRPTWVICRIWMRRVAPCPVCPMPSCRSRVVACRVDVGRNVVDPRKGHTYLRVAEKVSNIFTYRAILAWKWLCPLWSMKRTS